MESANAAVAASHPLAAEAAMEMLRRSGTAADAAIAAAAMLTVVEPTGCGLGGDAFAQYWDGSGLHGLNASGRSPALLTAQDIPLDGWLSVTTPGQVAGWVALWKRFGSLPFEVLLEPAIRVAREGFTVTPHVAAGIVRSKERFAGVEGCEEWFRLFGDIGEHFENPDLAGALSSIAETEGSSFYTGGLAEAIDATSRAQGGLLRSADLAGFRVEWVKPLQVTAFGATLHEIPPNSQGIAALLALSLLGKSDGSLHAEVESMKAAFSALYSSIGDGDPHGIVLSSDLPRTASKPRPWHPRHGGTVCLAVGAPDGTMCSFIQSNYCGFGSGVVVPGTGITLQNRGAGFVNQPRHPNHVGPNKRPLHTIIPGFITRDGAPLCAFGWMGGPMQPQGHLQFMRRVYRDGEPIQAAIDAPRWQAAGGKSIWVEEGFDTEELIEMGHEVERREAIHFGGAQAVCRLPDGNYTGGSDLRKDGLLLLEDIT